MENSQDAASLRGRKNWVSMTLIPSITSASVGGAVVGCCFGSLLAPSHHFSEGIFFGILAGTGVGFVTAWIGAAIVGMVRFILNR
jgi:hypothetical protein